jgi:hypothetical protein
MVVTLACILGIVSLAAVGKPIPDSLIVITGLAGAAMFGASAQRGTSPPKGEK